MLDSRAATGMLEVLAISTVRCMSGLPVCGSSNSGNSTSTSVISFPRSPQPTYTTMSALPNFAIDCCVTVLPDPNGPGIAAVPPMVSGKSTSRIRIPVRNGVTGSSFCCTGRGCRTAQG